MRGGEAVPSKTDLYDHDFYTWTQAQAAALRARKAEALDWTNLAEEIESLGKSDRRALRSHLEGLVTHLLKWRYQPAGRETGHSWYSTIRAHRNQIEAILEDSPSLQRAVPDLLARRYRSARQDASMETHLPLATFPESCPWTPAQLLAEDFWPEA
jgi:Domain of unknown function DUF29